MAEGLPFTWLYFYLGFCMILIRIQLLSLSYEIPSIKVLSHWYLTLKFLIHATPGLNPASWRKCNSEGDYFPCWVICSVLQHFWHMVWNTTHMLTWDLIRWYTLSPPPGTVSGWWSANMETIDHWYFNSSWQTSNHFLMDISFSSNSSGLAFQTL